jgi:hypothetical protein
LRGALGEPPEYGVLNVDLTVADGVPLGPARTSTRRPVAIAIATSSCPGATSATTSRFCSRQADVGLASVGRR